MELMIGVPARIRLLYHFQLAGDGVNGIYHIIVLAEIKLCGSVRHVKGTVGFYLTSRIDLENAFFRHLDLVFPHVFRVA